jgi:hypothetical protein
MSLSRFPDLPVEVVQSLLSAIPDISSLISAVLTCSSLYRCFKDAESLITASVLLNQIDFEVLPDAFATFESSKIVPPTEESVIAFVKTHLHCRKHPNLRWAVTDALQMSEFHKSVDYLAACFVEYALERTDSSYPPSRNEINRVQRALYHFEMHRNTCAGSWITMRNSSSGEWEYNQQPYLAHQQKAIFFDNFSCWENDQ